MEYIYSDELMHHGILGQKWGVRRYQNKDGSLTAKGKQRISRYQNYRRTELNENSGSHVSKIIAKYGSKSKSDSYKTEEAAFDKKTDLYYKKMNKYVDDYAKKHRGEEDTTDIAINKFMNTNFSKKYRDDLLKVTMSAYNDRKVRRYMNKLSNASIKDW